MNEATSLSYFEKRQRTNKKYIKYQFNSSAIKNLLDNTEDNLTEVEKLD
jgi:hypothetical protein